METASLVYCCGVSTDPQHRFFVNTYTKESTWEKPTAPAHRPDADAPPGGPPPSYSGSGAMPGCGNEKHNPNNPYNQAANVDDDAKLAARLQAEEEARVKAGGNADRGAADSYYQTGGNNQSYGAPPQSSPYGQQGGISPYGGGASGPTSPPYDQNQQPQGGDGKRGLLGKLLGKASKPHGGGGYGQQGYPPQGYPQHQQGYPQQGYGGYPQQGYGGYPPQQPMYAQQPPKKSGGGLGMAGGAALGLGGGLVGGMLVRSSPLPAAVARRLQGQGTNCSLAGRRN